VTQINGIENKNSNHLAAHLPPYHATFCDDSTAEASDTRSRRQWRVYMAGMAHAMGTTLTGTQKLLGTN